MPGPGAHLRGAISISPSVEYMERAYDDAKYGDFSRRPYIDIVIPSLDRSVGGAARASTSCPASCSTRPTSCARATWDEKREAFGDTVIDTIAEYAPNLKKIILHRQVLTPARPRARVGPHRRQHLPGRAVARAALLPAAGAGLGALPDAACANLYMCGSATHPGGGIMGAPGRIAALEILKDWDRGKVA